MSRSFGGDLAQLFGPFSNHHMLIIITWNSPLVCQFSNFQNYKKCQKPPIHNTDMEEPNHIFQALLKVCQEPPLFISDLEYVDGS